jgi:hypothetical protein
MPTQTNINLDIGWIKWPFSSVMDKMAHSPVMDKMALITCDG